MYTHTQTYNLFRLNHTTSSTHPHLLILVGGLCLCLSMDRFNRMGGNHYPRNGRDIIFLLCCFIISLILSILSYEIYGTTKHLTMLLVPQCFNRGVYHMLSELCFCGTNLMLFMEGVIDRFPERSDST